MLTVTKKKIILYFSAAQILFEIVEAYDRRGVKVYFTKLRENQMKLFKRSGVWDKLGENHFFR